MKRMETVVAGIVSLLFVSLVGCEEGRSQTAEPTESSEQNELVATTAISRVVFVDQEQCCDCTQDRIDVTWEALSTAIEDEDIQIERFHRDTQETAVAPFQEMRPIMVVPAVYFLDPEGNLVEQLQGELTVEQIRAVF